jgi:dihydropyrimidine dehydrogenase (NAD+) subunit PreA
VPIWAKLTPSTTDIVLEARGALLGGADAITSSNTFPSLPLVDRESLEFEMNVDGKVSSGGLGGPAILPLSLAKVAQLTQAFPDKSFSGIGGIADFSHALNYFLLGCGTVQVCTAALLDHAIGPNVIRALKTGMTDSMVRHGWRSLEDFRVCVAIASLRTRRSVVPIPRRTTAGTKRKGTRHRRRNYGRCKILSIAADSRKN